MLSIRSKYNFMLFFYIISEFVLIIFMVETGLFAFNVIAISWFFIMGFLLGKQKCARCYSPLTFKGTFLGMPISGGLCPDKCVNCGYDFTKEN